MSSNATNATTPLMCEPGGEGGLIFPLFETEQAWSPVVRAILYIFALCYIFLGVAIVAEKFMEGIEMITSKKLRVCNNKTGNIVTIHRWNPTVANLTLLALGSSAPEIILSVLEICLNDFFAGVLGPSTIVGSAAFNLFVIVAVCIFAIPTGESRSIKEYDVFIITCVFSIVAYVWLVVIVQVISPDVVQPWESGVTLALFPVLIVFSYMADIGYFKPKPVDENERLKAAIPSHTYLDESALTAAGHLGDDVSNRMPPALAHIVRKMQWQQQQEAAGGKPTSIYDLSGRAIDNPSGILSFKQDMMEVRAADRRPSEHRKGACEVSVIKVPVMRCNGTDGTVTCKYHMDNRADPRGPHDHPRFRGCRNFAVPGEDYVDESGQLTFGPGEYQKDIEVQIFAKDNWECSDSFQIILGEATGGAVFNPHDDGGDKSSILTIKIQARNNQDVTKATIAWKFIDGAVNLDNRRLGRKQWREAIRQSICYDVGGGGEQGCSIDRVMHFISMPWSLPFSIMVPPTVYAGGWACFLMALAFIGGLTLIIIDFANLFGCVTGLRDEITAITIVALGTSMPDLFASKAAACQDECADASIVNVTGSNSVNVFMGIGIPWMIGSLYWEVLSPTEDWLTKYGSDFLAQYPNGAFIVKGGDLGFSVVVYLIGAFTALGVLRYRRTNCGGELGGPPGLKTLSAILFVMLWFFYIGMSIWKIYSPEASVWNQILAIVIGVVVLENIVLGLGAILKFAGVFNENQGKSGGSAELQALEEGRPPDKVIKRHDTYILNPQPQKYGLHSSPTPSPFISLAAKPDGLRFDSIVTAGFNKYGENEDLRVSLQVAGLVCLAATKFRLNSLKRRQLLGLYHPPLQAIFNQPDRRLRPAGDMVPNNVSRKLVFGRPVQFHDESLTNSGGSSISLTTVCIVFVAVAKLKRLWKQAHPPPLPPPSVPPPWSANASPAQENTLLPVVWQSSGRHEHEAADSMQPFAFPSGSPVSHSPAEASSPAEVVQPRGNPLAAVRSWIRRFVGSHVVDFFAVGLCAYAAGHLGQPAALGA